MYCPNCGEEIGTKAKFCSHCGEAINDISETPDELPKIESDTPYGKKATTSTKKPMGILRKIAIALFSFTLIVTIIGSLSDSNTDKADKAVSEGVLAEVSAEDLKAQGLEFDKRAWADYLKLYEAHNYFMGSIDAYSNGRATKLDFYDYCKKVEKNFGQASISFSYGKTEDEKTYLSTFPTFALADQSAAKSLLKYLDSDATKDLSKAKESIDRAKEAATIIASNRVVLLKKIGLSEEELKEKINQAAADVEALDSKKN